MRFSLACRALVAAVVLASNAPAQALTYGLNGGSEGWPADKREAVVHAMDEAVATYNRYGYFDRHLTANYNPGVPTAEANYDGFISFGSQYSARTAMHEISHALGTGTYWGFDGGQWDMNTAAGRLIQVFDGQGARLNTGGTHYWPYGLNYDNEDGSAARERLCKLVSALRFDMGIVQDSDGDALPDDWEMFHFGSLDESGDGDPDADGIPNRYEYATDCDPTLAAPVTDGGTYVLRSQISERALTVIDGSDAEGAGTEQRAPDGSAPQRWVVTYVGEGYFSFTNENSGKVLEVPGTDTTSGLPVQQAEWTGEFKQQWRITGGPGARDGYYQIANRQTGRVVDGFDGADGADVLQYPFIGDIPQQFWSFELIGSPEPDAGPGDAGGASADAGGASSTGGASSGGDSGSGGASSGGANGAGAPVTDDAGSTASDPDSESDGGCTCRVASPRRAPGYAAFPLAGVALGLLRRRRRRPGSGARSAFRSP